MPGLPGHPPLYRRRGRSLTEQGGALADRLLACLSGLLLALSFPKFDQAWLAWGALVPLFISLLRAQTAKRSFLRALLSGLTFYLILLYWIVPTMTTGGVPLPLAVLGWLALAVVLSLEVGLFGLLLHPVRPAGPLIWAAAWALMEWSKASLLGRFPWALLGYSQWEHPMILQVAEFGGVYAVGFVVVAVNAALAATLYDFGAPGEEHRKRIGQAAGVTALALLLGAHRLSQSAPAAGPAFRVAVLQPAVDQYQKWDATYAAAIRERIVEMSSSAARGADLVVWPEASVPGWINEPIERKWVADVAKLTGAPQLVGAPYLSGPLGFNAAVLFDASGVETARYFKRVLVPFGEYVPMRRLLGGIVSVLNEMGDFDAGAMDQAPVQTPGGLVAPNICYEAVFPKAIRRMTVKGAGIHVNLVNDAWYLDTAGPHQHFMMNVLRAVENRAWWVRAANSGISALIDPYGRVVKTLGLGERGVLRVEVPAQPAHKPTFYAWAGDVFVFVCFVAWILVAMFTTLNTKRRTGRVEDMLLRMGR